MTLTQREYALKGKITPDMKAVAAHEGLEVEDILAGIKTGEIVLTKNTLRQIPALGIGKGLRTKVNANLGTSDHCPGISKELQKLAIAEEAGADAIMDLSTGGDLDLIRRSVLANATAVIGTVPIYQAMVDALRTTGDLMNVTAEALFQVIEKQCRDGVDFVTIHCGVTKEVVRQLKQQPRIAGVVSRGGAFLVKWIEQTGNENPLFKNFDRILEICKTYDVVISLGDGLRPGALADATDAAQIQELVHLGELTRKCLTAGVQVMVEGPGHMPLNQIETNIRLQKSLCHGVPFYVLGPLVTDIAPGYDHITSAIGGTLAAAAGADFLCYVTPAEHLGLPTIDDVREGVMVSRIAAHAADICKNPRFRNQDDRMSIARKALDWPTQFSLAIDPQKAKAMRAERSPGEIDTCTMCGPFCSMK